MCKKSPFSVLYITFLLLLAVFPAQAGGLKVVEFYTSQGCPSCPAGDRIFGQIADSDPDVLALGCHVTYFNRRWQDTMSRIFCDARQGAYRDSGTTQKVYTPQVVVNGKYEAVGNDGSTVHAALDNADPLPLIALSESGGYLDISLPPMMLSRKADIWLFALNDNQSVRIGDGANEGKTISYARPVKNLTKLLSWDGASMTMSFPVQNMPADSYAVIAQYRDNSGIIAAGKTR